MDLSADQARRIAIAAQGLADKRPAGKVDRRHVRKVLDRIAPLQIDSVNVLVRAHELPLFARLGPHPRDAVPDLTYRRRELFESWAHMASFVPVSFHPLLRWRMARSVQDSARFIERMGRERPGFVDAVYDYVAEHGPIAASELPEGGSSKGTWWSWGDGKTVLEVLFWAGRLAVADRRGAFERLYDVAERVFPQEVLDAPTPGIEDAHRELLRHAARAMGVATVKDLADYFRMRATECRARVAELVEEGALVEVQVEGWKDKAYLFADAKVPRKVDARALLSPFDSLVWERARTERVFGMHLRIEIYTPAPKRVYGYYVLPFLLGDTLVGRVDLKADRAAGSLLALGAFLEPGHTAKAVAPALADELRLMAEWLGLERVVASDRGDLGAALSRTLRARSR